LASALTAPAPPTEEKTSNDSAEEAWCGWIQIFFVEGPVSLGLATVLYLMATDALTGRQNILGLFIGTFHALWIFFVFFTWQLLAPGIWNGTNGTNGESKAAGGNFWVWSVMSTIAVFVFSILNYVDDLQNSRSLLALAGLFSAARVCISFYGAYWHGFKAYATVHNIPLSLSCKTLPIWTQIVISALGCLAISTLGFNPRFGYTFFSVLLIIYILICILGLFLIPSPEMKDFFAVLSLITGASAPQIVVTGAFIPFRDLFGNFYDPIIGLIYFYVTVSLVLLLLWELLDFIGLGGVSRRFNERDIKLLVLYPMQVYLELTISILFLEPDLGSASFFVLLVAVTVIDMSFLTGFAHEVFHYVVNPTGDNTPPGKAVYMIQKYQFIQQKIFAEAFATPTVLIMVAVDYSGFGGKLITSRQDLTPRKMERVMISLLIVIVIEWIAGSISSYLLYKRMTRIKTAAIEHTYKNNPFRSRSANRAARDKKKEIKEMEIKVSSEELSGSPGAGNQTKYNASVSLGAGNNPIRYLFGISDKSEASTTPNPGSPSNHSRNENPLPKRPRRQPTPVFAKDFPRLHPGQDNLEGRFLKRAAKHRPIFALGAQLALGGIMAVLLRTEGCEGLRCK